MFKLFFNRLYIYTCALFSLLLIHVGHAQTSSIISFKSVIEYHDELNKKYTDESNIVRINLTRAVHHFSLTGETELNARQGEIITFPFILKNLGTQTDNFDYIVRSYNTAQYEKTPKFYQDNNNDQKLDGSIDTAIPITGTEEVGIAPDGTHSFIIAAQLKSSLQPGDKAEIEIEVKSQKTGNSEKVNLVIHLFGNKPILMLSSNPASESTVESGDRIEYMLEIDQVVDLILAKKNYHVGGEIKNGVLIELTAPNHTEINLAFLPTSNIPDAELVYHASGLSNLHWVPDSSFADKTRPAFFIPETSIVKDQTFNINYNVTVDPTAKNNDEIYHEIYMNLDQDDVFGPEDAVSNVVKHLVSHDLKIMVTAEPDNNQPVIPGNKISYKVQLDEINALDNKQQIYKTNEGDLAGILIESELPSNTKIGDLSELNRTITPFSEGFVSFAVKEDNAPDSPWILLRDHSSDAITLPEDMKITKIGLFNKDNDLKHAENSGSFSYQLMVSNISEIRTQFSFDENNDGKADIVSNEIIHQVNVRKNSLQFVTPKEKISSPSDLVSADQFRDAGLYRLSDGSDQDIYQNGIYVKLDSYSLNKNRSAQERYIVELENPENGSKLNIELIETSQNSGVFISSWPVSLDENLAPINNDQLICSKENASYCTFPASQNQVLMLLFSELNLMDRIRISPSGIVFDSLSLAPVSGIKLSVLDQSGKNPAPLNVSDEIYLNQTTDLNGRFMIPELPEGSYYIRIENTENYLFPSTLSPDQFSGTQYHVINASYGQKGYQNNGNSGLFTFQNGQIIPVFDIPVDVDTSKSIGLIVEKSVNYTIAEISDLLTYTIKLTNKSPAMAKNITLKDKPPFGFRYVSGSAQVSAEEQTLDIKPERTGEGGLQWVLPIINPDQSIEISYVMQVGASSAKGIQTNMAIAEGIDAFGKQMRSKPAYAEVRISDSGLLSDRGFIIGSVWIDDNHDGLRQPSELALPNIRIWLEDGAWVETDPDGLYSIYGVKPGLHVARLDTTTLPKGLNPSGKENKFAGDSKSRFVDLTRGEMHRADFPVSCTLKKACGKKSALRIKLAEFSQKSKNADLLGQALNSTGILDQSLNNNQLNRQGNAITKDGDISSGHIKASRHNASSKKGKKEQINSQNKAHKTDSKNHHIPSETKNAKPSNSEEESLTHLESIMEITKRATTKQAQKGTWLWPEGNYVDGGKFMVIIPSKYADPVLYVNHKAVSKDQLGELVENQKTKALVAAWYAVETPEINNLVEVRAKDKAGKEKTLASYTFIQPGQANSIELIPEKQSFAADGLSTAKVNLVLKDDFGNLVKGLNVLTAHLNRGNFVQDDLRPSQHGYQFAVKDGKAVLEIKAPDLSADIELRVENSDKTKISRQKLSFHSPLREMIAVGVVEIGGRQRVKSLNTELEAVNIKDQFPHKMKVDGRGSVFLKGRIKGDYLLTLAYDSDKGDQDQLFRDIDPERYYPIYGDSSAKGYEAQSRSSLYVRVEKDNFSALYGDYRVDHDNSIRSLGSYNQNLTGVKVRLERGPGLLEAFGARVKNQKHSELIEGNGTALLYNLANTPILNGSEVIIMEERDRNTPGLVISSTTLTRFTDYNIDYINGQIQFQKTIPTYNENGNPVFLRINYETRNKVNAYNVIGLRGKLENEKVKIWTSITSDQNPERKRNTATIGGELKLKNGRAWVEGGYMEHGDGKSGKAVQAGVEVTAKGVELKTRYGWAEKNFDNPNSPISNGRTEFQASLKKKLDSSTDVKLSGHSSQNHDSNAARHSAGLLVSKQIHNWNIDAGLRWTTLKNATSEEDYMSVIAALSRNFDFYGRKGKIGLEAEQNIDDWSRYRLAVSGEVNVMKETSIYVNHDLVNNLPDITYAPDLTINQNGTQQNRTRIGIKTSILPNTNVYGEWRIPQALDSRTGEAAFGVKSEWEIIPGLALSPHFEAVKTVSKEDDKPLQDSWAVSVSLADRRFEDLRQSVRVETRHNKSSAYYGVRGGIAKDFGKTLSGVVKLDTRYIDHKQKGDEKRFSFTVGGARRPIYSGLDILSYYQFVYEDFADNKKDREAHILSTHLNSKLSQQTALSIRGATKWQKMKQTGYESSAQLFDTRLAFDLTDRLDAELQAGLRLSNLGASTEYALGAGLSYWLTKNARMTLGYNFVGFEDKDLDKQGFNVEGFYWRLAFKFDEGLFEWLE